MYWLAADCGVKQADRPTLSVLLTERDRQRPIASTGWLSIREAEQCPDRVADSRRSEADSQCSVSRDREYCENSD